MAQRIPFTIYRLRSQDSTVDQQQNVQPTIEAYQYLVGVSEDDINRKNADPHRNSIGTIFLTKANFIDSSGIPDTALIHDIPVSYYAQSSIFLDEATGTNTEVNMTSLVVFIEGTPYFIKRTQVDEDALDPVPDQFEFYVNPQRIQINKEKLISEVRTRGGWDVQHWGEKLTTITVDGITGGLHRDISKSAKPGEIGQTIDKDKGIDSSTAWKKLRILNSFYDNDHGKTPAKKLFRLAFSIFEDYYIGYFSNFTGPEIVADKPYLMTFSFIFKVEEKITESIFRLEYTRTGIETKSNNEPIGPGVPNG